METAKITIVDPWIFTIQGKAYNVCVGLVQFIPITQVTKVIKPKNSMSLMFQEKFVMFHNPIGQSVSHALNFNVESSPLHLLY